MVFLVPLDLPLPPRPVFLAWFTTAVEDCVPTSSFAKPRARQNRPSERFQFTSKGACVKKEESKHQGLLREHRYRGTWLITPISLATTTSITQVPPFSFDETIRLSFLFLFLFFSGKSRCESALDFPGHRQLNDTRTLNWEQNCLESLVPASCQ